MIEPMLKLQVTNKNCLVRDIFAYLPDLDLDLQTYSDFLREEGFNQRN